MKKLFLSLIILLALAPLTFAQSHFEGKIRYKIKLTGENADQMSAFMPESYEYLISGKKLKFKMNGGMAAAIKASSRFFASSSDAFRVVWSSPSGSNGVGVSVINFSTFTIEAKNE